MRDYMHLYRECVTDVDVLSGKWDIFVSAFNDSERVRVVFDRVNAKNKHWIIHREYGYHANEMPKKNAFLCEAMDEATILGFWESCIDQSCVGRRDICIDATGFMRPHLMFLVNLLVSRGVRKFDVLYSEPKYYIKKDRTRFSGLHVEEVRQVVGFEGSSHVGGTSDVLIIGAGYETHLIAEVAEDKDRAKKVVLLGLPSLRPDMYQQNAWRTWQADDALDGGTGERHFAPASDAFATATILSELVGREQQNASIGHLYLSPLATKAQAVGFALCYLTELQNSNASIIFPFTQTYERETSIGFARAWLHTLEFDCPK